MYPVTVQTHVKYGSPKFFLYKINWQVCMHHAMAHKSWQIRTCSTMNVHVGLEITSEMPRILNHNAKWDLDSSHWTKPHVIQAMPGVGYVIYWNSLEWF